MQYNPIGGFFINLFFSVLTKTYSIIMANVIMLFMGDMESPGHSIKCQATDSNVYIDIDTPTNGDIGSFISLDIPTAIKFTRELKKQIAYSKYISEHIPE